MDPTKMPSFWEKIWNERDVQVMVLISLALQLFLLFAGNVRRRRRVGWLKFLVWLAYLAAYAVAAFAIGLFSQYEEKYKLRSSELSSEHLHTLTMPFLWAPFLLIHLGGPDTIAALSVEDNNLWARQLLNLLIQLGLALYVFWKSFNLLDSNLLAVAVPLFVAGIIKYGERIWALRRGSRDGLDRRVGKEYMKRVIERVGRIEARPQRPVGEILEPRALASAISSRGLLVGRTLLQLGSRAAAEVVHPFAENEGTEAKLKFVLTELGMIFDRLYTKTWVLHSWTGGLFRCVALVAMVVAFVLFWVNQHLDAHRTTNAVITYTLFVAAIFVEVYSIFMVIASPWTRARSKALRWLSGKLACCFPSQGLSSPYMGQFNLTDYSVSTKSRRKCISKVFQALGLEKHWRNFWYVNRVDDNKIIDYIVGLFNFEPDRSGEGSRKLEFGEELRFLLTIPFEHVLVRLHIYTEMHLGTLDGGSSEDRDKAELVAECRKLSNYLMYLMAVYPSMLPVGSAAQDLMSFFAEWVRENHGNLTKARILVKYENEMIDTEIASTSPFKESATLESLKDIKEVWARLLIYAAGKCPMELHARQLGSGLELLTVVGSLLIHCSLGNVGSRELNLLALPPPSTSTTQQWPTPMKWASVHETDLTTIIKQEETLYAFEFSQQPTSPEQREPALYVQAWAPDSKQDEQVHQQPPTTAPGVVTEGIGCVLLICCVWKKGPVFTATFSPLSQMFVANALPEAWWTSVLLIIRLYLVVRGKQEEEATAAAAEALLPDILRMLKHASYYISSIFFANPKMFGFKSKSCGPPDMTDAPW